jgi:hypothetical protein
MPDEKFGINFQLRNKPFLIVNLHEFLDPGLIGLKVLYSEMDPAEIRLI